MIYTISDLNIDNVAQMEKMGYNSMESFHKYIIENWNQTVKVSDIVYVLGELGDDAEIIKSIVTQLNGEKYFLSRSEKFTRQQIKDMGFKRRIGLMMYHTLKDGNTVLYSPKEIENPVAYENEYKVICCDSLNHISGMTNGILLSVEAEKWDYSPLSQDSIVEIHQNMREFESMDTFSENRSDVKEFGEE